ncbi:MAG: conserved phage C-terminal domain-containing protein [Bacillus sp. (in: firmicutes)]
MSKLLIQENPMMILPSLAKKIGLNQAIVIQQFHYWLLSSKHNIDGRKWIYNSYKEWELQFTFWSGKTVERTIRSLEDQGYLQSANHNRSKQDKTKWYTINYEKLAELDESFKDNVPSSARHIDELKKTKSITETDNQSADTGQIDELKSSECLTESDNLYQPLPEITTKTNTESIYTPLPIAEIITYLNIKTGSNYKSSSTKTRELVKARFNEGFQLEDFMKVIDIKTAEWMNDSLWCKYLRPETLFGPKFESYRNQKIGKKKKFYNEEDFNLDD